MSMSRERHRALIAEAMYLLGSECVHCGEDDLDQLQFDHIDPRTKLANCSPTAMGVYAFWREVMKCQLLCGPCNVVKSDTITV